MLLLCLSDEELVIFRMIGRRWRRPALSGRSGFNITANRAPKLTMGSHYEITFSRWKAFSIAQPFWLGPTGILPVENYSAARKRTLGARQQHESLSVTKSYAFDHMIIAN